MSRKTPEELIALEKARHAQTMEKLIAKARESRVNISDMYKNNRIGEHRIIVIGEGFEYSIEEHKKKLMHEGQEASVLFVINTKNENRLTLEVPQDFEVY